MHSDIHGFCRRRFDLFAIAQFALQSWWVGSTTISLLTNPVSGSVYPPFGLVVTAMADHRRGDAGGLVGPGHRSHIGMTSRAAFNAARPPCTRSFRR